MKKLFSIVFIIFFACSFNKPGNYANIKFSQNKYDFGILPLREEVQYSFEFTNPGDNALLIHNVKTSCGCMVAAWPQKPIKPNESGKITVKYDSEYPGMFHKEVTVYYNGTDSPVVIQIKGQVEYPEEENEKETE